MSVTPLRAAHHEALPVGEAISGSIINSPYDSRGIISGQNRFSSGYGINRKRAVEKPSLFSVSPSPVPHCTWGPTGPAQHQEVPVATPMGLVAIPNACQRSYPASGCQWPPLTGADGHPCGWGCPGWTPAPCRLCTGLAFIFSLSFLVCL